jgi:hypothetical protein
MLLVEAFNSYLSARAPEFQTTMENHLIPVDNDSGIWTDDYKKFVQQRAALIKNEIDLAI